MSGMHVAVVYESVFGNTRALAEAIAEGIRAAEPGVGVSCTSVSEAGPAAAAADLLVAGGPTHFLGMTSPRSRRMARRYQAQPTASDPRHAAGEQPAGPGIREWLAGLPDAAGGRRAAAFDTRLDTLFPGSAARLIGRSLHDHGYLVIAAPEGFTVAAIQGPLSPGELERARAWGAALAKGLKRPGPDPFQKAPPPRPGRRTRSTLRARLPHAAAVHPDAYVPGRELRRGQPLHHPRRTAQHGPLKAVEITAEDGRLTIRAERRDERKEPHRSEFRYGTFTQTLALSAMADTEHITASYDKGIPGVSVPVPEVMPAGRRIQITKAGG